MPSLRTSQAIGGPLINRAAAAGYYRFIGIDLELTDANQSGGATTYVVSFNNTDTLIATLATNITFDRCYVAGAPTYGVNHAISAEGMYIEVTGCYIERCWQITSGDTNCIAAWNSIGPYKIHNNYLEAQGETTIFGGADTHLASPYMPSDIEITNNHYFKNYFTGTGNLDGSSNLVITAVTSGKLTPGMYVTAASGLIPPTYTWITSGPAGGGVGTYTMAHNATGSITGDTISGSPQGKNMIEFKVGQRVFVDSNFFENAGAPLQSRSALVLTVRNQGGANPWYALLDFTISNNIFTHCPNGGMQLLLEDGNTGVTQPTAISHRILYRNNLFLLATNDGSTTTDTMLITSNLANGPAGGGGRGSDVIYDHNTWVGLAIGTNSGLHSIIDIGTPNACIFNNFVWSNNLWTVAQYGILKAGVAGSNWAAAVQSICTNAVSVANVFAGYSDGTMPAGNFFPANNAAIGFTSYGSAVAAAGYALLNTSAYYKQGVSGLGQGPGSGGIADGTDIGCNVLLLPTS
jgi:hypothetical protein